MKRTLPTIWSEHLPNGVIYPEFPDNSMYEFLEDRAASFLNDIAIEFEGAKTTYAGLLRQIDAAASALLYQGIGKGDTVTVVSPNIPQAVVSIYAINRVGAIANMLHPLLPAKEIQYHIENTESKAVFILDRLFEKIETVQWTHCPAMICLYSVNDALPFPKKLLVKKAKPNTDCKSVILWKDFMAKQAKTPAYPLSAPEDIALILYSGGTTGTQKGICLTNRNVNCQAVMGQEVGICMQKARSLAVMPIFHGYGLCSAIHNMLTCGSHLYMVPVFDPIKCSRLIFKKRIEVIFGVPALYETLIRSREMQTKDCVFLKQLFCGGDKIRPRTEHSFNAHMEKAGSSARILCGYGLSECVTACISNSVFSNKEGTAGMVFPDTLVKIVRPGTEEEVPAGTFGELCVSSPCVMKGYYKDEAATDNVLHKDKDGRTWLHTGDVFSADDEGFYTFHSRLSRMLVVNGYNVYPEMVETVISRIAGIKQCAVVGKPARAGGDRVVAVVSTEDGSITPDAVMEACKKSLPEYAVPHQVIIKTRLPVTKVGKIDFMKVAEDISND